MSFIKNLQQKPEQTRRSIALLVAVLITTGIGGSWLAVRDFSIGGAFADAGEGNQASASQAAGDERRVRSPLELLAEDIGALYESAEQRAGEIFKGAELPF